MTFALDINRFAELAGRRANQVVRKVVLDISKGVIKKSPVDTGRFKGNWQYGTDSAPAGAVEIYDEDGRGTLAHIAGQVPQQAAGHVHYIVNNLPYAQALEDGHSTQSPPGNMVASTVSEFQQIVREALNEPT